MGNIVYYLEDVAEIVLTNPIQSAGKLLTGCKVNSGSLTEIRRLYNRFNMKRKGLGHFIGLVDFRMICRKTPIEDLEEQIFKQFSKHKTRQISFYELLGTLIMFASTTWQHKVHFAMRVFDFDGNLCLSEDEFTILISAFLNGLGHVTETSMPRPAELGKVSKVVFNAADINPDGLITLDE
jgi:Ca2+-binding EF-hand superfamily protein